MRHIKVGRNSAEWGVRDDCDHFVYVMSHLQGGALRGPCKIGISKHPERRRLQVERDIGSPIVLVAKFAFWRRDHARRVELAFHRACDVYRVEGEWFDMCPADAIGLMSMNLVAFADGVLGADKTADIFDAYDHLGVPGFYQCLDECDFQKAMALS